MKVFDESKGVAYFVNDEYYIPMTTHSIKSLNSFSNLPITIFTSCVDAFDKQQFKNLTTVKIQDPLLKIDQKSKLKFNHPSWKYKLNNFLNIPYEATLFVDSDTEFLADPEPLISDDYDVAACRETNFNTIGKEYSNMTNYEVGSRLKHAFNTGFIILNKNKKVINFINHAIDIFSILEKNFNPSETWRCNDQYALNKSYMESPNLTVKFLPCEWNVREPMFGLIEDPKLIHCHGLQH